MEVIGAFLAGFASGWVVRSTVTSARGLAVKAIATFYVAQDRARRWVATEREYFEDLIAEGRSQYEAERARSARRPTPSNRPTQVRRQERAA
jgi:hypothetical protein